MAPLVRIWHFQDVQNNHLASLWGAEILINLCHQLGDPFGRLSPDMLINGAEKGITVSAIKKLQGQLLSALCSVEAGQPVQDLLPEVVTTTFKACEEYKPHLWVDVLSNLKGVHCPSWASGMWQHLLQQWCASYFGDVVCTAKLVCLCTVWRLISKDDCQKWQKQ